MRFITDAQEGAAADPAREARGPPPPSLSSPSPPPEVFVVSKGRPRCPTSRQLAALRVAHTIVVEPAEHSAYRDAHAMTTTPNVRLAVLPIGGMGVAFARNFVLETLAPPVGFFWLLDDDIEAFFIAKPAATAPGGWRRERASAWHEVLAVPPAVAADTAIALFALEYERYQRGPVAASLVVGSYATVAVCIDRHRMPRGLRYRGLLREDYDLCLALFSRGLQCARRRDVAMRVPAMGARPGGMTPIYRDEASNDIRRDNARFCATWGELGGVIVGRAPRLEQAAFTAVKVRWGACRRHFFSTQSAVEEGRRRRRRRSTLLELTVAEALARLHHKQHDEGTGERGVL